MTTSRGAGAIGLALASATLLTACGTPYYYGYDRYGYYDRPSYYSSPYERCYGPSQPSYCFPTFSGTVVIAGTPYRNLRYRDGAYGREFWFDGRWVRT